MVGLISKPMANKEKKMIPSLDSKSHPKSLYGSHAGRHFYKTDYKICADFGLVGSNEKK